MREKQDELNTSVHQIGELKKDLATLEGLKQSNLVQQQSLEEEIKSLKAQQKEMETTHKSQV